MNMSISTKLNPCPYCNGTLNLQVYLTSLGEPAGNIYCVTKGCDKPYSDFNDWAGLDAILEEHGSDHDE